MTHTHAGQESSTHTCYEDDTVCPLCTPEVVFDAPTVHLRLHLMHKVIVTFDYAEPADSNHLYCETCDEVAAYLAW